MNVVMLGNTILKINFTYVVVCDHGTIFHTAKVCLHDDAVLKRLFLHLSNLN